MTIKKSDEEIWFWYKHFTKFRASGLSHPAYCIKHDLNITTFRNMKYRMLLNSDINIREYHRKVAIGMNYRDSSLSCSEFAKLNGIKSKQLGDIMTHISYLDIIERLKKDTKVQELTFHPILPKANPPGIVTQSIEVSEVMEKQNDIEIIISKGVKVSISPNIDSMKIIKIIELLKDL